VRVRDKMRMAVSRVIFLCKGIFMGLPPWVG
jgi:hypothetical protein